MPNPSRDQSLPPSEDTPPRLTSWKEIAAHMGRSVRTVQRWEREFGLPVHRYPTAKGEAVFAFPKELDGWRKTPSSDHATEADADGNGRLPVNGSSEPQGGPSVPPAAASTADQAPTLPADAPAAAGDDVRPGPDPTEAPSLSSPWDSSPHSQPDARTVPASRARRWAVLLGLAGLVVVAVTAVLMAGWVAGRAPTSSDPSSVRIDQERVSAFDAGGTLLWTSSLPFASWMSQAEHEAFNRDWFPRGRSLVRDLDGDGRREVVVAVSDSSLKQAAVVCFDADGQERWRRSPDRTAEFGYGRMTAPWSPFWIITTNAPASPHSLWVSWAHSPYFGAFAERLDGKTGEPAAVYWSAGHITALATGIVEGRPVVFLGGAHNETRGASLAVYDLSMPAASPPAANPIYACSNCPPERPLAFFVFPKTKLARDLRAETSNLGLMGIQQDAAGQVTLVVQQVSGSEESSSAEVIYRFNPQLRPTSAEVAESYLDLHQRLEREGRLDYPFTAEEERSLFPVLSWEDGRFVPITPPEFRAERE